MYTCIPAPLHVSLYSFLLLEEEDEEEEEDYEDDVFIVFVLLSIESREILNVQRTQVLATQ